MKKMRLCQHKSKDVCAIAEEKSKICSVSFSTVLLFAVYGLTYTLKDFARAYLKMSLQKDAFIQKLQPHRFAIASHSVQHKQNSKPSNSLR